MDDICVKVNGLVGFMLDVDRDEIYEGLSIEKYSYHQQFIDEVLNYCIGDQNSSLIMLHGLTCTRRTGINIQYKALSDRSLVESYTHHSREQKYSQQHQTHQQSERFRRSTLCWNLLIKLFISYYNHLRR